MELSREYPVRDIFDNLLPECKKMFKVLVSYIEGRADQRVFLKEENYVSIKNALSLVPEEKKSSYVKMLQLCQRIYMHSPLEYEIPSNLMSVFYH
jgi:hypothetical protein